MNDKEFEELVLEALKDIPDYFKKKLENISIIVEELPDRTVLKQMKKSPYEILGLYQGVPFKQRGSFYGNVLPDRIIIYKLPIERVCSNDEIYLRFKNKKDISIERKRDEAIKTTVRKVVMHEIGHYFGLSEEELRRLSY